MVGIGFESIWKVGGFKSFPKSFNKWESVEGSWLTGVFDDIGEMSMKTK
jgi:hypothetical protein